MLNLLRKHFDNGERPINVDASNMVWLNSKTANWIAPESNAELGFLWEDSDSKGLFVKLPKTFNGTIEADGTVLHSVVIQGLLKYTLPQDQETKTLDVGSYFGATSEAIHTMSSVDHEVILYIRTNGSIKINKL